LRLPQDLVALHAAVASRQFTGLNDADSARIRIWTTDETSLEVSTVSVAVSQVTRAALGEWTVLYDDQLVETIQRLRTERLPNETGGIL
jgi:hypothetical protein